MAGKKSSEYATLPAGAEVLWGKPEDEVSALKALVCCTGVGAMGAQGGFVDCTTLADTQKQYISDLPDGPDKSLTFLDNPADQSLTDFLNAAENRDVVKFYVWLPNGRTATSLIALAGWQMVEVKSPAGAPMQIEVKGKQNDIQWGFAATSPGGKKAKSAPAGASAAKNS
ncbi:phage tail protein [Salmonella enterica]|nr:phage tail protein [Salmonella enterica subsp. enterica]EGC4745128.1 phage tail protein [Salmonella enterica]EEG6275432.1 phage tail protein [Salmonella enterica subsp. enterica]EGL4350695.1 phage tail protein [Salmonella enterica]EGL4359934.1 phage tail protein [Salmonella enterica]